jgi:hypothetical protein
MAQVVLVKLLMPQGDSLFQLIGEKCGLALKREKRGRIKRCAAAKYAFMKSHLCSSTGKTSGKCRGFMVDHIKALASGGADDPSNMQWQTVAAVKEKDKWERK